MTGALTIIPRSDAAGKYCFITSEIKTIVTLDQYYTKAANCIFRIFLIFNFIYFLVSEDLI